MSKKIIIVSFALLSIIYGFGLHAQSVTTNINSNWEFTYGDAAVNSKKSSEIDWQKIDLPHTFNSIDAFDDEPGYYRGITTYKKIIDHKPELNRRTIIKIGAANQRAHVYCNGKFVGEHIGGYLAFAFDLSEFLKRGKNEILITVNNEHDPTIVPLKGDFTFYGGIYRGVELITTSDIHFDITSYANDGIYITPWKVDSTRARLIIESHINNFAKDLPNYSLQIFDESGSSILRIRKSISQPESQVIIRDTIKINNPKLWNLDNPHLYTAELKLTTELGDPLDEKRVPFGIRYFNFDIDNGFSLNGKPIKLMGVNRHQDRPDQGFALTQQDHEDDFAHMMELGINFWRTAHYPQDKSLLNLCDEEGIVVSMEIPLDHEMTDSNDFYNNSSEMLREMIRQYYNHPSIFIWAYMNEMFLGKQTIRDSTFIKNTVDYAVVLDSICRAEDADRFTMIPNHGDFDVYYTSGITNIPMIVAWNLYYGWYEPEFKGFGDFVDRAFDSIKKPMIISEYGAGADPRLRSFSPTRFDFTQEWAVDFHNSHINQIMERDFIAGSAVWNMFDFGSEARIDAVPHINNKGLLTYDRLPKDVYYLYEAAWNSQTAQEINFNPAHQSQTYPSMSASVAFPIRVFSENNFVSYQIADGPPIALKKDGYMFTGKAELGQGRNKINIFNPKNRKKTAVTQTIEIRPYQKLDTLRINFGAEFYLFEKDKIPWIPFIESRSNKILGKNPYVFMPRDRGVGSNKAIANTKLDPIYQTSVRAIDGINFPMPNGTYQVIIHAAAISSQDVGKTVFEIEREDMDPLEFNFTADDASYRAMTQKIKMTVTDNTFKLLIKKVSGQSFINAIELIKMK